MAQVTLADTNFWLALAISGHRFHIPAAEWLKHERSSGTIAFCRTTQISFCRLMTTPGLLNLYGHPAFTNVEAWSLYEGLRGADEITYLEEPADLDEHWKQFACRRSASPKLWMDAYLAAFAVAGGLRLVTTDTGFRQFANLDLALLSVN